MADAKETPVARNRSQRTKLTLGDFGNASVVKLDPNGQADPAIKMVLDKNKGRYPMGIILGNASGFVKRTSQKDDTTFEGLAGEFRFIPADKARDELESGVLFIPDAFHNLIAAKLRKALEADPNAKCKMALAVSSIPAKNAAGYSWDMMPLTAPEPNNAIDELLSDILTIPAVKTLMLTANK